MKKILLIVLAFFAFAEGFSQTQLWSKTTEGKLNILEKTERASTPSEFQLYNLKLSSLKTQLATAPARFTSKTSDVIISFPNAEGKLERFRIFESSVMEPELAKKHQEIQSYVGQGIDDTSANIYLTTTIFGVHGMVLSSKGTYYIDPYTKDVQNYIVYNKSTLTTNTQYICHVEDEAIDVNSTTPLNAILASDGLMRTYRMAMACTTEYSTYHVQAAISAGTLLPTATDDAKKDVVLAAMNVTVSRLNSVYERDISLRMVLVANNKNVIFLGGPLDDSFDNDNENNILLTQSKAVIDANIGFDNYDIGHTVSTGGGGVAQSPSVCLDGKARGITGLPSPVGDAYDIDFVAHEVGHQFGASHTFSGVGGNCTSPGTRAAAYAVEPGSGTTIMAYAGICAPVNVQAHSDAYFHAVSMAQIVSHINGAGNCSVNVPNGNNAPLIDVMPSYTIPAGTPFVLKGIATDPDGDQLTYCWEQYNAGANTSLPTQTTTASIPNFRSLNPTASPNRYFPAFSSVLSNTLSTTWEVIPTVARTMNFALTVRDNKLVNGGQTARRNVGVTFNASGTPFAVTSQNILGQYWLAGESKNITWNVGTTNVAPISTENVNILLTTDGGQTFTTLLANTPNDGSADIVVPNIPASLTCRIMIEAVGNVYYALNTAPFALGYIITTDCQEYTINTPFAIPDNGSGFTTRTFSVPTAGTISDVNLTANISHTKLNDLSIAFLSPANTQISLFNRGCASTATTASFNATFDDQGSAIVCGTNITGNVSPVQPLSTFNGQSRQGTWIVGFRDLAATNTGTVNSLTLTVCSQNVVLSTKTFGLADFKIYPNPNNGNFNVQFNSTSGKDIKVNVYDLSGRQIISKSFQNNGMFSENIQMNTIQKGIYIVTVIDGDVKETKKIVIE